MRSIVILLFSAYSISTTVGTPETDEIVREMNDIRDCARRASSENGQELPPEFAKKPSKSAKFINTLSTGQQEALLSLTLAAWLTGHCGNTENCTSADCVRRYSKVLQQIAEYKAAAPEKVPPEDPDPDPAVPEPLPRGMEFYPDDLWLTDGTHSVRYVLNGYRLCRPAALEAGGMYAAEAVKTALCNINKQDEIKQEVVRVADGMNKIACDQPQNCAGIMCDSGYTDIVSTMGNWTKPCVG